MSITEVWESLLWSCWEVRIGANINFLAQDRALWCYLPIILCERQLQGRNKFCLCSDFHACQVLKNGDNFLLEQPHDSPYAPVSLITNVFHLIFHWSKQDSKRDFSQSLNFRTHKPVRFYKHFENWQRRIVENKHEISLQLI